MKKSIDYRKSFRKNLDNKWTWETFVWVDGAMYADCVIKSPIGTLFDTRDKAHENLLDVLWKIGMIKKSQQPLP